MKVAMEKSRRFQNMENNAQGQLFEKAIQTGCAIYREAGRADINKMPEPYRVLRLNTVNHTFTGRHIAKAQPDFIGAMKGGRAIVFEAKKTTSDRMNHNVLTETQMEALQCHYDLGAEAGVCCAIQDNYFFIPWIVWKTMKERYGRQYITPQDIEEYRIPFDGGVLFLDYIHKNLEEA